MKAEERKFRVMKSVEGEPYTEVLLEERLFNALIELELFNTTFHYLMVNKLLSDELLENMKILNKETLSIIKEYNMSKYDVRAHYKFDDVSR